MKIIDHDPTRPAPQEAQPRRLMIGEDAAALSDAEIPGICWIVLQDLV